MAHTGPQPLDLAFSFDTTGSMSSVIGEVRTNIAEMLARLSSDIAEIRVALIAHGDYGDKYETEIRDFGTSTPDLVQFVRTVSMTSGGDEPECYELVLQQARTKLSWRRHSTKALVLVGDAFPHELKSARNKYKIDWKAETNLLRQLGVTVYCVQSGSSAASTNFMKTVADMTGGLRLPLAEFRGVRDFLMAIAYREGGNDDLQDVYEREVRARDGAGLSGDVSAMLGLVRRPTGSGPPTRTVSAASKASSKAPKRPAAAARSAAAKAGAAKKVAVKKSPRTKTTVAKITKTVAGVPSPKKSRSPTSNTSLAWSPWRQFARPGSSRGSLTSTWQPFGTGSVRRLVHCNRSGPGDAGKQLLLELAVQTCPGSRRLPVFGRVLRSKSGGSGGGPHSVTPARLLTGLAGARAQLLRVLRQGMRVFVRDAVLPASGKRSSRRLLTTYAWNSGRSVRCSGVFVSVTKKSLQR